MDDDFEIEVTDLRTGQVLKTARDLPPPSVPSMSLAPSALPAPAGGGGDQDSELEITSLSTTTTPTAPGQGGALPDLVLPPPGRRRSRRHIIGAIVTSALVVVVLVGLLGGVVGKGGITLGLFPTPAPTATLAPGGDSFYMADGVPWGRLLADGKLVDVSYSSQQPSIFSLSTGHHTIEYDAAPFPRMRCTVSVPAAKADSCPLFTPDQGWATNNSILDATRGLDLGAKLSRLPPESLKALVAATEQSLGAPISTTTVPAGGRYQSANGNVVVTTEPLQAQMFYILSSAPSDNMFDGQNCITLCDVPFPNGGPGDGSSWEVLANILPVWRYTTSAGTTMQLPAMPQLPNASIVRSGEPGPALFLDVTWDNAWQVQPLLNKGTDQGCFGAMQVLYQSNILGGGQNGNGYMSTQVLAPNPADGCLLVFAVGDSNGNITGKQLWFLYRFGLIFAANPTAHQVLRGLPVATGSEEMLVGQLAKQLQPPFGAQQT